MDYAQYFHKSELTPVICQHMLTGEVLMLGYANEEALRKTVETGTAWFFSRSRQKLWNKGETSGNVLYVWEIFSDCDDDTLIYQCSPTGPVCHLGTPTCFRSIWLNEDEE